MKLTARLAYKQLKNNQIRTRWTVVAIVLSVALMITVTEFVASGNQMLISFLGDKYGNYGSSYFFLLLIPAALFGFIILFMSITVISNVFRVSARERMVEFGILKCSGATKKQIVEIVVYESLWLFLISVPVGIIMGLAVTSIGIYTANYFLEELNQLTNIMIRDFSLTLKFVFSPLAIFIATIISMLTVFYSAWRPATKVANIPAVESIHWNEANNMNTTLKKESKLISTWLGIEGALAYKNLRRKKYSFRATFNSLCVGVILFVSLGGLVLQANEIESFLNPDMHDTVVSEYSSAYEREIIEDTDRRKTTYVHPINEKSANRITERLNEYDEGYIFGSGSDMDSYVANLSSGDVTLEMLEVIELDKLTLPVEIIVLDQGNYKELCKKADVDIGANILLNSYSYNDFGKYIDIQPFSNSLSEIKLSTADGYTEIIPIDGILSKEFVPEELFYPNTNPVRVVVQKAFVRGFTWYSTPENPKEFIKYANEILNEEFQNREDSSYMEDKFSVRVYMMDDYMKVMNIAISLVTIFMYSFVALLMLIGLTNVISTLFTNVLIRAREFAVLNSVGMTHNSINKMLNYESIIISVKALGLGTPIGIIVTVLINLPVRSLLPISYRLPWVSIIIVIIIVMTINLAITKYATKKLKEQNVIEAIRGVD